MRIRFAPVLVVLPLLALTGCQTGGVAAVVPIAGGGQINVDLGPNGPVPGEADGYRAVATVVPGSEKSQIEYDFGLQAQQTPDLTRIQIVDISDEKPEPILDVSHPAFKNREWTQKSAPLTPDDPRLKWIYQITPSFRVYQFTITHADGKKTTFNHVAMYPPFLKAMIRARWGLKY